MALQKVQSWMKWFFVFLYIFFLLLNTFNAAAIIRREDVESDDDGSEEQNRRAEDLKFFEVDALGDDYVDFGAITGANGAFSWHATYPIEHR